MSAMQYKDFIFPHSPANITVEEPGRSAVHLCPGHGEVVQSLGRGKRAIKCEGSFLGATPEEAVSLMEAFRERAADGKPGVLFLPGMHPMMAMVAASAFLAAGDGKSLAYTLRFLETGDAQ